MLTLEGVMRTEFSEGLDLQAAAAEASAEVVAPDRTLVLARPDGAPLATWGLPLPAPWQPPRRPSTTVDTIVLDRDPSAATPQRAGRVQRPPLRCRRAGATRRPRARTRRAPARPGGRCAGRARRCRGGRMARRPADAPAARRHGHAGHRHHRAQRLGTAVRAPQRRRARSLATAFNAVLDRLGTALHAQRQFMADASHQVRTPVSVVHTTAQVTLARDARPEHEYREALTIVGEQSARLTRLVDAMFLLSRAEAQGIPLAREPLYLDELVSECARALRVVADERGVHVRPAATPRWPSRATTCCCGRWSATSSTTPSATPGPRARSPRRWRRNGSSAVHARHRRRPRRARGAPRARVPAVRAARREHRRGRPGPADRALDRGGARRPSRARPRGRRRRPRSSQRCRCHSSVIFRSSCRLVSFASNGAPNSCRIVSCAPSPSWLR